MNFEPWDAHRAFVAAHVATGAVALACYWMALLSRKGSDRHRRWGRTLLVLLVLVTASIGPVLVLRPGFTPAELVQFTYLALCVPTVSMLAWTAIRWKDDVERFRGWHFRVLGVVLFLLGGVVLAAGIATARPLTMLFSWVGLVYGGAMIRFAWMRARPGPRWALSWHLNAVCGLFNAVHGTFLAVAARSAFDAGPRDEVALASQLATLAIALGLRVWYGRSRGAPWRLSAPALAPAR